MLLPSRFQTPSKSSQDGVVLLVGLISLVIISMVSIYSMRTSTIQEKITSNQRNKTISLMAAEFGVNYITAKIDDKTCTAASLSGCTIPNPLKVSNQSNYNAYWSTEGNPVVSGNTITFTVLGTTRDSAGVGSSVLARSKITFSIQVPVDEIAGRVIETEGNVQVKGRLTVTGGGHANGSWSVTSNQNSVTSGVLSADGNIDVGGVPAAQLSPNNGENISLPTVESFYSSQLSGSFNNTCSFTSNQNLNGQIIRCKSATFNGPVSNGTIVVDDNVSIGKNDSLLGITLITTGNIDIEPAATGVIGSSAQPSTLATTGNIQVKGNIGNVYGDMRANGSIDLKGNGNSVINGQLRAQGNIYANGGLEILNPSGTPYTPATPTTIKSWFEVI